MHITSRKRVLHVVTCVISSFLLATPGYIDGYHSHQQANHTRENGPLAEFRTHMLRAISTLSISRQCNILTAILKGSGGDPPRIIDEFMSQVPYEHFPCVPLTTSSGSSVNSSELLRATDFYITRLFNNLPQAFQCKIVSDVTLQSREDFTNEAMSETWSAISQKLLLLDISADECVDTSPRKIVSSTHVQIGVRLRKGMPLEAWLERFRKILPTIYLAYVSKIGRVSEFVSGWTKNHNGAKIPLIAANQFLVKVEEAPATDASVAMVSFSLYSRDTSGDYRLIKGDDVAASLEAIGRAVLNSYVQAEVIGWRAHREREDARFERMRKRKYKPSSLETVRLQSYFPKYLVKFFKSMKNDGRCYVLRQISSSVKLDLLAVERHYHSIKMLPKKYYCSRGGKYNSKAHEKQLGPLASVWERLDTYIRSVSNPTSKPILMTTIVPQVQNSTVIRETRPLNSMEIVMFVLLGFLCLLIMVFVANCIVFTFKTKKLNTSYTANIHAPQVVFGDIDGVKDDGVKTTVCPPGKITLTENPQPAKSVFSVGKFPDGNHWRFLSLASDSGVTVCSDAPSLSEEESERVSSV